MKDKNHFADAFRKFLLEENLEMAYREKLLVESWEAIMGKPISSRTNGVFIKDKILIVKLSSAPLKQELTLQKEKVLERINEDFEGVIKDVRFL